MNREETNFEITVDKIEEAGYNASMAGLALNKKKNPENMQKVGMKLCSKDFGHNKFLEHVEIWLLVRAPLRWWKQADTYRLSSKNSESTMHTIMDHPLSRKDFEKSLKYDITNPVVRLVVNLFVPVYLWFANFLIKHSQFNLITIFLIDGFMQTRMWKMSYKTFRNIYTQRLNHKQPHWRYFCHSVLKQLDHPEFMRFDR